MEKTLGQSIGIVDKTCKVTNSHGVEVTINVKIDFSTCADVDIRSWLASDRIIAGQRPWRTLSEKELKELNGKTFNASTIGTKVKSQAEMLADAEQTLANMDTGAAEELLRKVIELKKAQQEQK